MAAAAALLALQRPFAFYSPDVSFHAAKLLRASHGEIFRDPVTGTPSIYPPAFHAVFGSLNRVLGLDPLHLAVLIEVVDFVGLMAAAFLLARAVIGESAEAALCTLCVPLLFYSPTGRHVLLVNPANFALALQVAAFAAVCSALRSGRDRILAAGALLSGAAVNVVWYDAVPALALLSTAAVDRFRRTRDLRRVLPLLAFLLPFAFTAVHLLAVREVLPASRGLVSAGLDLSVARQWMEAIVTRGNTRFGATLDRSPWASAYYLLVLLPFGIVVAATAIAGSFGRWATPIDDEERRRLRTLCVAGLLVFVLSFPLSMTGDVPRVVRAQFPGWVLLLAVAARVRPRGRALDRALAALPALGLAMLACTVWHSGLEATSAPPPTTQAVIRLIEGLPGHADTRIFVTESNLRRLLPFVEFRSFVNHFHGRYYSQDLASANAMYDAYVHIRDRSGPWADDLARYDVRLLAFRQGEGEAEREAGSRYLGDGRAVLANPEWWVLAPPPADRR